MASKAKAAAKEAVLEEAPEVAEGDAPKKKFSLKLIIIAVAGVAVLGGGGYGAYAMFFSHKEEKVAAPLVKPAVFVDLPEVLVNLSNSGSDRTQYLKVKMTLELSDQALMQQI